MQTVMGMPSFLQVQSATEGNWTLIATSPFKHTEGVKKLALP
jgi:hypothetical protein